MARRAFCETSRTCLMKPSLGGFPGGLELLHGLVSGISYIRYRVSDGTAHSYTRSGHLLAGHAEIPVELCM